jgi:riboflavin kinase/FMN adenylyltransferase
MPYFIEGEVSRGDGRGASLGIPTANLPLSPEAELLKRGVYAAAVYIDGIRYPAITNIGACPTFGARELHSETQIFGEVGDIYGKKIRVYLLDFIREEKLFDSKDELIMQINVDKKYANAVYMETKWQEIGLN